MVALTGDFHIVSAGITAGFAAVFFSSGYGAQARCVRALFSFLICHHDSFLSYFSDSLRITILYVAPFTRPNQTSLKWLADPAGLRWPRYTYRLHSDLQTPNRR
jgi:hypothetical protein